MQTQHICCTLFCSVPARVSLNPLFLGRDSAHFPGLCVPPPLSLGITSLEKSDPLLGKSKAGQESVTRLSLWIQGRGAGWRRMGRWEGRGGVKQESGSAGVDEFTCFILFTHHSTFARCSCFTQMRKPRLRISVLNNWFSAKLAARSCRLYHCMSKRQGLIKNEGNQDQICKHL